MSELRLARNLTFASLFVLATACGGDDGGGDSTSAEDSTGVDTGMETGATDGTETSDAGTGTDTAGDTTETTGTDTGTTGDTGDTTGDGDGDGDGDGSANCDMGYSTFASTNPAMTTNLDVAGLISCNQDITIVATGATVCANDDGAGGYYYTIETVAFNDVPPTSCGLAELGLTGISIDNIGTGMEVVVPQAGGMAVGNQSVTVNGNAEGSALGMAIPPTPLTDFNGQLPEGDVQFGATDTTVTYADDSTVIATATPDVMGIMITVTLTGLDGVLTVAQ